MNRLSSLALSSALVLFAAACTDCGNEGTDDAGPTLALSDAEVQELCVLYTLGSTRLADSYFHLFGLTACSAEDTFSDYDDATIEAIEDECRPGAFYYDIFVTARDGGRVDIDMDKTRACVAKGRAARESETIERYNNGEGALAALFDDADCQGAITALVDEGGECEQQWDCTGDLYCEPDPPDAATLRCLAPAQDGDRCGGARYCDDDLFCTDNETCAPAIAEGSDCVNDPLGGRECVVGAFCDDADTGLCQPLLAQDAACTGDGQCEEGLLCTADAFADPPTPGTCVTPPATVDDGDPCDAAADVCTAFCSVCRPPSSGAATVCLDRGGDGDYCEGDEHCRGGFGCNGGSCTALAVVEGPGLGESCNVNDGCAEGYCVNGQCVAGDENDPCDPDALECQSDFVCLVVAMAGTCVPRAESGEACIAGDCVDTAFCNASDQCETLKEAGAACSDDVVCVSGTCLGSSTCAAAGPSCDESREYFIQFITLGLLLPVFARLRRRRRSRR